MSNTKELLKLVAENPDLPVVFLVDYEIVGEGYGRWLGSFGNAYVGEYALFNDRYYDDRDDFKDAYFDIYELDIAYACNYESFFDEENDERVEKYLDEIADEHFIKAIIVNIDIPDWSDEE